MGGYIYGHFVYCFPLIRSTGKAGFFIGSVVKTCSECGIEKQDSEFRCYKKTIGTVLAHMCKKCRHILGKRIYAKNRYKIMSKQEKEVAKIRTRIWYSKHKDLYKEYEKNRIRTPEQIERRKQRHKERYLEIKSNPALYDEEKRKRNERYRKNHPVKTKAIVDIVASKEKARIAKKKEHERYNKKYPGKQKTSSKKAREVLTDAYVLDTLAKLGFPRGYKNKDIIELQRNRILIKRTLKQKEASK